LTLIRYRTAIITAWQIPRFSDLIGCDLGEVWSLELGKFGGGCLGLLLLLVLVPPPGLRPLIVLQQDVVRPVVTELDKSFEEEDYPQPLHPVTLYTAVTGTDTVKC
jgi:hypothetical protein